MHALLQSLSRASHWLPSSGKSSGHTSSKRMTSSRARMREDTALHIKRSACVGPCMAREEQLTNIVHDAAHNQHVASALWRHICDGATHAPVCKQVTFRVAYVQQHR